VVALSAVPKGPTRRRSNDTTPRPSLQRSNTGKSASSTQVESLASEHQQLESGVEQSREVDETSGLPSFPRTTDRRLHLTREDLYDLSVARTKPNPQIRL